MDANILEVHNQSLEYSEEDFLRDVKEVKKINDEYKSKFSKNPKALTVTYGCQMNEHDSEKMNWILEEMGFEISEDLEEANFVIYNTCAIRENAELKVYGKIGSLKKMKEEREDFKIALCGCMMQIESIRSTIEDKYSHVDVIFGTSRIHKLPELVLRTYREEGTIVEVGDSTHEIVENIDASRKFDYKSFVNIMYGCNNFCTYCVVPYTRGREVSRQPEEILKEIHKLGENNCKEVTLLGQNVNSYGKSLNSNYDFPSLLRDIDKIPGIERIRFMTSHPRDISDELIECYGELKNLSNHLHLPVQSGSNRILKAMNRHYTREEYLEIIEKLRKTKPDIAISTDIIIGFPGETEEDFLDTLDLITKVEFDFAYVFIYSLREGTKAAKMKEQIPYEVKHRRFELLSDKINSIVLEKNKKLIGTSVKVLVDDVSKNDDTMLSGRTEEFKLVHFKGDKSLIGSIVDVKIEDAKTFSIQGKIID